MSKKPTIEELLEASAKARREAFGSSPQMPNPMRARLQEEVARQNRSVPTPAKQSLFSLWFSRLAIATAVVLIIGLPVWLQFREQPSSTSNEFAPVTERSLTENLPQVEKTTAPSKEIAKDQPDSLNQNAERKGASELPSSNPTSEPTLIAKKSDSPASADAGSTSTESPNLTKLGGAPGEVASTDALAQQPDEKNELSASTAPAPAATKPENAPVLNAPKLTLDEGKLNQTSIAFAGKAVQPEPQALSQRFANSSATQAGMVASRGVASNNLQATFGNRAIQSRAKLNTPVNVMQNFDFQQNGNQIRVIDSDGSTYSGEIASGAAKDKRPKQIQNSSNAISFRALGANNTLNKTVVFEGSYIAPNPADQSKNQTANQQQAPSRIIGVAKVHGGPEIKVDALPAK